VLFAYDAARSINLDKAEQRIQETTKREIIRHKRRAPSYFEYQPPPLRIPRHRADQPRPLPRRSHCRSSGLRFRCHGSDLPHFYPGSLLEVSQELYDNDFLLTDSRLRADQLLKQLGDAVSNAGIANIVEDYIIYHIESLAHLLTSMP
jgi:hypothetical protein